MSTAQTTENYNLPIFAQGDKGNWFDFNTGFQAIDAAIKANATNIAALQQGSIEMLTDFNWVEVPHTPKTQSLVTITSLNVYSNELLNLLYICLDINVASDIEEQANGKIELSTLTIDKTSKASFIDTLKIAEADTEWWENKTLINTFNLEFNTSKVLQLTFDKTKPIYAGTYKASVVVPYIHIFTEQ